MILKWRNCACIIPVIILLFTRILTGTDDHGLSARFDLPGHRRRYRED